MFSGTMFQVSELRNIALDKYICFQILKAWSAVGLTSSRMVVSPGIFKWGELWMKITRDL